MHKLLRRQMKRHLGNKVFDSPECQSFFQAVNDAYEQSYMDYNMLEHAMDLASEELRLKNEKLEEEVARRIEAQKEIERLNHQIELILNSAGEGILGLDRKGQITFLNPAARSLLGPGSGELVGKNFHSQVHHTRADGQLLALEDCPIYETIRDGRVRSSSDDLFWKTDGTSFPVEYISNPILEGENLKGAVITFKDISSRKEVESTLKLLNVILDRRVQERTLELKKAYEIQKKEIAERKRVESELKELNLKAKNTSQAKSEFLARIGRELRSPIESILEHGKNLQENFSGERDYQACNRHIEQVKRWSLELRRLIDDVLQISCIESGNVHLDTRPVDFQNLLKDTLTLVEPMAREKRVTFRLQFPEELDMTVQADPDRLRQVLFHVLNNSIKFNKLNGFVLIVANRQQDSDFLTLEIFDSGVGIPQEKQKNLFEPFANGTLSTNRNSSGSGMGLAISKQLMDWMGGRIGINSIENEGSCVSLSLPVENRGQTAAGNEGS